MQGMHTVFLSEIQLVQQVKLFVILVACALLGSLLNGFDESKHLVNLLDFFAYAKIKVAQPENMMKI